MKRSPSRFDVEPPPTSTGLCLRCDADVVVRTDEPPFYLEDRPHSDIRSTACSADQTWSSSRLDPVGPETLALQSTMRQLNISEDSSDDYRSVIDDLTVENQELRQRLAKYERLHCSHLQREKLFEVTFHDLPAEKRQELEHALKEFATSIDRSSPAATSASGLAGRRRRRPQRSPGNGDENTSSNSASQPRPVDSGYSSLSISGAPSTRSPRSLRRPVPGTGPNQSSVGRHHPAQRNSSVRDARAPGTIVEQKKKLVARRLEQLFTGRLSQCGAQAAVRQPHERSDLAVAQDRTGSDAVGGAHPESTGVREARILPLGRELSRDSLEAVQGTAPVTSTRGPSPPSAPSSPEQRPTNPRDLDLRRGSRATDNLDYIRHLGITTPSVDHAANAEPTQGWVYLNLLSNMAQLHTLNVTPTFIRDAVSESSKRLEVSEDGRKIRWKGRNAAGKLGGENSISDAGLGSADSMDADDAQASHESFRDGISGDDSGHLGAMGYGDLRRSSEGSAEVGPHAKGDYFSSAWSPSRDRFAYRPLFFRKDSREDDHSGSAYDSPCSRSPTPPAAVARVEDGTPDPYGVILDSSRATDADNTVVGGPVIFYRGARFCTDLSGERPKGSRPGLAGHRYSPVTTDVIGTDRSTERPSSPPLGARLRRLSWDTPVGTPDDMSLYDGDRSDCESTTSLDLDGLEAGLEAPDPSGSPAILDFEVSGLAGVHPADHFLVHVRTLRTGQRGRSPSGMYDGRLRPLGGQLARVNEILGGRGSVERRGAVVGAHVSYSTTWTELPPSALPPPSCVFQPSASSVGSSSRSTSPSPSGSSEPSHPSEYRSMPARPPLRQQASFATSGSSSSIDLMAGALIPNPALFPAAAAPCNDEILLEKEDLGVSDSSNHPVLAPPPPPPPHHSAMSKPSQSAFTPSNKVRFSAVPTMAKADGEVKTRKRRCPLVQRSGQVFSDECGVQEQGRNKLCKLSNPVVMNSGC